jgi:ribosomal protein L32
MKKRKTRRRKDHMNIIVLNEENKFETVHVPNHLADDYISDFDITRVHTKENVYDFLLRHNSLKVK